MTDVSRIKVGDVIANYPKMCELLGEEKQKGSPQKRQIKNWERFFKFERNGHKYIVVEIYKTAAPKIDGRSFGNNSRYNIYTKLLLLDYLYQSTVEEPNNETKIIEVTSKTIMTKVGLCNTNYSNEEFVESLVSCGKITGEDKILFYRRVGAKLHEVVRSTINSLVLTKKVTSIKQLYKITDNDKLRTATEDEEEQIEEVTKFILSSMELSNIRDVFYWNRQMVFYKKVNAELASRYGWTAAFKTHEITLNNNLEEDRQQNILSQEDRTKHLSTVNELIHAFVDNQAKHDFEYYLNSSNEDPAITSGHFKLPLDYVEKQEYIARLLLKVIA